MKDILKNKYVFLGVTLLIGLILGWLIKPSNHQTTQSLDHQLIESSDHQIWTCSMHPQIRMNEPGQCPICGMDLIPAEGKADENPMALEMTENAMKLANIQTTVVGSGALSGSREIRLNGKVKADERKVYVQSSHIPGRIEQLNVNFTGEPVSRGKVLAMVYSPELVTAQQELLQANKIKSTQPELFNAAKNKLKNWKLTEAQIKTILENGKPIERFPILSDVSGIAVEKKINLGDYVQRGTPVYEIADLSSVWIQFEVYESDLPWVKVGNKLSYTLSSLPGEKFEGTVNFIDPVIDPQTRVTMARVEVKNQKGTFKPEMFATGIIKNELKTASTASLSVPKSAVMWTGERSVVYIKSQTDNKAYFTLREVTLGASLGDAYEVKSGLEAGEEIVTYGTFTVDAAAQLAGKPSMMNPKGGVVATGHQHGANHSPQTTPLKDDQPEVNEKFKDQLQGLLEPYLVLKDAFVETNAKEAAITAKKLQAELDKVDMGLLKGEAHNVWMPLLEKLNSSINKISQSVDVEIQRKAFSELSNFYYQAIRQFELSGLDAYYQYCPMAFGNQGAYWISKDTVISNPYFGSKMLRCGETKSEIK